MGKKKKKKTEDDLLPVARWLPRSVVLMLAVLGVLAVLAVWLTSRRRASIPSPAAPATTAPVVTEDRGPTPEQERFFRERFLADWERIRTTYPIPDIRQRFDHLMGRVASKDIRLHASPFYMPGEPDAYAMADRQGDLKVMQFFAPSIMDLYSKILDQDTRDDVIIGVLLHEEYHLDHHIFAHPIGFVNHDVLMAEESETWWWCAETLYVPMRASGRLRNLPVPDSVDSALRAYKDAHGDPMSQAWLNFSRGATSPR